MKRILALMLVMGLFYITMSGLSSAQQKAADNPDAVKSSQKQAQTKSDYNRDELKTGLARAFYDALVGVENDLDNENENEEVEGQDGKKYSAFEEARRTIFQADPILARVKAQNKKALEKLRNPPRRIFPGQKLPPKQQAAKGKQVLKKQIEAQEKLIKKQQQKLNHLKKELVSVPAKS